MYHHFMKKYLTDEEKSAGDSMTEKTTAVILAIVMTSMFAFSGCKTEKAATDKYISGADFSSEASFMATENDRLLLEWDDENKCIVLTVKESGEKWSSIPYKYLEGRGSSANVSSTLNITVVDSVTLQQTTLRGYTEAYENGEIIAEKAENGIKVTYFFENYGISIPVKYSLGDRFLSASVDYREIRESEKYPILSFSLMPFLCSAENNGNGYLFVPCGSGALMYARETPETERSFTGEVFGADYSRPNPVNTSNPEEVRLPVFGVKNGKSAMLAVIENGAEAAALEAAAGNPRTGYSNIYPSFYVRGYDVYDKSTYDSLKDDLVRISERKAEIQAEVRYYPLSGEDADYNGMAKTYRKYLSDSGKLIGNTAGGSPYSLTLLGGAEVSSSTLGVPVQRLKIMTSFEDAVKIIDTVETAASESPAVLLKGFGESGISVGKLAGGFKISGKYGAKETLFDYYNKNGITNYTDFDIIRYKRSGKGFSYSSDCAKTAIHKAADRYEAIGPLRIYEDSRKYRVIGRQELPAALQKVINSAKKNDLTGVSLLTLGEYAYSDYSSKETYVKGQMAKDVTSIINNLKKVGLGVAVGSNSYAAATGDTVFDTPTDNGYYNCFDEQIPFYQMIFGACRQLYSSPVNTSDNIREKILDSVIGGCGLNFALIGNYRSEYTEIYSEKLYAMYYTDNIDLIRETLEAYLPVYEKIKGKHIEKYEIISDKLSKTVFENGVVLYANHSESKIVSPAGVLSAYEYRLAEQREKQ